MPKGGARPGAGRPKRADALVAKTVRLTPEAWAILEKSGRAPSVVIEELIMNTVQTLRPSTTPEREAWSSGNNAGKGYANSDIDALWAKRPTYQKTGAPADQPTGIYAPEAFEVMVTSDGRTAVADANGAWAVDIG